MFKQECMVKQVYLSPKAQSDNNSQISLLFLSDLLPHRWPFNPKLHHQIPFRQSSKPGAIWVHNQPPCHFCIPPRFITPLFPHFIRPHNPQPIDLSYLVLPARQNSLYRLLEFFVGFYSSCSLLCHLNQGHFPCSCFLIRFSLRWS